MFLEANDADTEAALDVIGGGLAGSTVLTRKRHNVTSRDYTPGFRIELHDKDLRIVQVAARNLGLSLPATALITSLVAALKARGDGGLDHSALAKLIRELNGLGGDA
jgi:2-hydroxy-3-oxopropionate reductase